VGNATQGNLLDPGAAPHDNLNFYVILWCRIAWCSVCRTCLRAVIASAAMTARLGADEAPPAFYADLSCEGNWKVFLNDIKAGKLLPEKGGRLNGFGTFTNLNLRRILGDAQSTSRFAFTATV